ncbi:MAG TPA: hypothetical protein VKH44_02780 [Pirellulaceae bacterium]|nr:hypothetical protein [Pirellulaceae bacterium]
MEARLAQVFVLVICPGLLGATYPTENFVVHAPTQEIATQVGRAAEHFRRQLAIEWLGYELPQWAAPCPIRVKVGQLGAGGQTTFSFFPNGNGSAEVCKWDMQIQGTLERILDSVLPHEVTHTIFACHFRRPLPRWADEGGATLAEHDSEKREQVLRLKQVIGSRRRIPLKNLFNIKEYPPDMQDVLTLYAEGYSVAELLVQEGGRARYLKFITDAHRDGWDKAVHAHYGYRGVDDLEKRWHTWVMAGSPEIELPRGQQLADATKGRRRADKHELIVRGQSPSADPFLDEPAVAVLETAKVREQPSGHASPAAAEFRDPPIRRQKNAIAAADSTPKREVASTDRRNAAWSADEAPSRKVTASESTPETETPARARARQRPQDVEIAEVRNSAMPRQATEWSEIPPDPRPSPLILRGRR